MKKALAALVALIAMLAMAGTATAQTAPPVLAPPSHDCRADYGTGHAQAALQGLACPPQGVRATRPTTSGTVEMIDSVSWYAGGYHYGAGYTDGLYPTFQRALGIFGNCCTVGIDVLGNNARSTDLEPSPGAFQNNPYSAGPWAYHEIHSAGNPRPIIYTMYAWWGAVKQSVADWGIPHCSSAMQSGCVLWWIADWTYSPGLFAGMDIRQWTDQAAGCCDESTAGSWVFGRGVDARSYNGGFQAGYASGRSKPYDRGFKARYPASFTPSSASDYNAGYNDGWESGWHYSANAGNASGKKAATYNLATWNGSWSLGYSFGWATGVGNPFYGYFVLTHHGHPSSNSAFNSGWVKGDPAGYDSEFNQGYLAREF